MSYSYTQTATEAFTLTHARELSSRVAADLYLCRQYYGYPNLDHITNLEGELTELLRGGYVRRYEFGFRESGDRVVSWRYEVDSTGRMTVSDSPGRVLSWADVSAASFYTYMWYTDAWSDLTAEERRRIKERLPVSRTSGDPPADGQGTWVSDKNYAAGGTTLSRTTFRPYR